MKENIDRREFVKRCAAAGAGIMAGASITKAFGTGTLPAEYDLCSVVGDRYFDNTTKAVDALGGMKKFVQRGATVGILVNSPLGNAGAFARPDITLAVAKMCLDAGAKQVYALNDISQKYWNRSKLSGTMRAEIESIRYSDEMTEVAIDRGRMLKKAEISKTLLSCDVYINIPIVKDHEGTRYTCSLKNMMGACSSSTCRRFHFGDSSGLSSLFKGYYSNVELLAQSIADANLLRQPDLCVVDATEILVTNGPSGPGEIRMPREVIAATNCLAADMYATRHLGLDWAELLVIRAAQQHGYGPKSLKEVRIQTI
jgi:uncharacterized protein (DUF362 family)